MVSGSGIRALAPNYDPAFANRRGAEIRAVATAAPRSCHTVPIFTLINSKGATYDKRRGEVKLSDLLS